MRALRFRVQNFRNIDDSGWIDLEKVTAFVGRNESGKTALLKALHKFNPSSISQEAFNPQRDFPRERYTSDFRPGQGGLGVWPACSVEFEIPDSIKEAVTSNADQPRYTPEKVVATRYYGGKLELTYEPTPPPQTVPPDPIIQSLRDLAAKARRLPNQEGNEEQSRNRKSELIDWATRWTDQLEAIADLRLERGELLLGRIQTEIDEKSDPTTADMIESLLGDLTAVKKSLEEPTISETLDGVIKGSLPVMIYFENYGVLDSAIYLPRFVETLRSGNNNPRTRTASAMFKIVGLDVEEIDKLGDRSTAEAEAQGQPADERQIRSDRRNINERSIRLNSASVEISQRLSNWWHQRRHEIRYRADGDYFRIWVTDNLRPNVEIELESRSKGFQWFFSFFMVFMAESDLEHKDAILLLDEPGHSLHPTAQQELIGFFEELSQKNQLLYTTHSPFLIDGEHLHRVRPVVEDAVGRSQVTNGWWPDDRDTIFPLQAAAGYAMIQSLLQRQKSLLVEGMSDFYYLHALSVQCARTCRRSLPDDIYITPCGGAAHVGHIASLFLGQNARPIIVLDADQAGRERRNSLLKELYAGVGGSVIMLDESIGRPGEEIEMEDVIGEAIILEGLSKVLATEFKIDEEDNALRGLTNRIRSTAERNGIDLGSGWKARVALELVGAWAESRTTLPDTVLDLADSLFCAIEASF